MALETGTAIEMAMVTARIMPTMPKLTMAHHNSNKNNTPGMCLGESNSSSSGNGDSTGAMMTATAAVAAMVKAEKTTIN